MINAVIVDDEPNNLTILHNLIREFCPDVKVVGTAANAARAEVVIREMTPELVFLDIEMPYGSGFDVLEKLRPVNFEVVFVTAFSEYTLKAFRYSALDYLLKPISIEQLLEAVHKAQENIRLKSFDRRLGSFFENFKRGAGDVPKIALTEKEGLIFVPITDIIRMEGSGGYTYVYIKNRARIVSTKNIKEYEDMLPEDKFCRVHKSHLVNIACITRYLRGRGGHLEMEDGSLIEVAVRRKDELVARLGLLNNDLKL
jgi:two-component system LytT family response regulator